MLNFSLQLKNNYKMFYILYSFMSISQSIQVQLFLYVNQLQIFEKICGNTKIKVYIYLCVYFLVGMFR